MFDFGLVLPSLGPCLRFGFSCGVSDAALVAFNAVVNKYFDIERVDRGPDISATSNSTEATSDPAAAAASEEGKSEAARAPRYNTDPPESRLRALMRLHRRPTIAPAAAVEPAAPNEPAASDEAAAAPGSGEVKAGP